MGSFLIEEAADVATVRWPGRVVVGRGAAGRGAGAAEGFSGAGCAVGRSGAAGADRVRLARRGGLSGSSDYPDAGLCALDGDQGAHGLGLRDTRARGLGLVAPTPLLFD